MANGIPIQSFADLLDHREIIRRQARVDLRRPVEQQRRRRAGLPVVAADGQRRHAHHPLAVDAERLSARRQDPRARSTRQHDVDEVGDVVEEVLAVVEHQQHIQVGEERGQRVCA